MVDRYSVLVEYSYVITWNFCPSPEPKQLPFTTILNLPAKECICWRQANRGPTYGDRLSVMRQNVDFALETFCPSPVQEHPTTPLMTSRVYKNGQSAEMF